MAKLVDALCSGRSVRKDVLVRIQFWAQAKKSCTKCGIFYLSATEACFKERLNKNPSERSECGFFCLGKTNLLRMSERSEDNPFSPSQKYLDR
jgi:hypothetical protein